VLPRGCVRSGCRGPPVLRRSAHHRVAQPFLAWSSRSPGSAFAVRSLFIAGTTCAWVSPWPRSPAGRQRRPAQPGVQHRRSTAGFARCSPRVNANTLCRSTSTCICAPGRWRAAERFSRAWHCRSSFEPPSRARPWRRILCRPRGGALSNASLPTAVLRLCSVGEWRAPERCSRRSLPAHRLSPRATVPAFGGCAFGFGSA